MKAGILVASVVMGMLGSVASAAYINNGDFETAGSSGADFASWLESGTNPAGALASGIQGRSLLLSATTSGGAATSGSLLQDVTGNLGKATVEMDVALSAGTASARSFNVFLRHTTATDQLNLRVTGSGANGDVSVYDGTSWVTLMTGAVTFSTSQSDLKVNHLKVELDYTTKTYNVYVTSASGVASQALGKSAFQITTTPVTSSTTLRQVVFSTSNWATNSWAVVDNVTVADASAPVPEPAAVSMLAVGGGIMLGWKRRSR